MLLLIGQVEQRFLGREAFQEVDLAASSAARQAPSRSIASKSCREWNRPCLAFWRARVGQDRWCWRCLRGPSLGAGGRRGRAAAAAFDDRNIEQIDQRLHDVRRGQPSVMLLGGGGWTEAARADVTAC